MRRGGTLYDAYQLSNSTVIPMYQGSTGEAALRVAEQMQGKYDLVQASSYALDTNLDNMRGHSADDPIVNETREFYKKKLRDATAAGNLEDLVPQVRQLGAQYVVDAQAISSINQQKAKWIEDNIENKDKNLTADQKARLAAMADYEYSRSPNKLQRNAQGRLVGSYSGTKVDENIDINKWVRENATDIISNATKGEAIQGMDGQWIVKTSSGTESISPDRVRNILRNAMANDEKVKGYMNMMGRISAFNVENSNITSPDDLKGDKYKGLKAAAKVYTDQGIPFKTALAKATQDLTMEEIQSRAEAVGVGTYAHTKSFSGIDVSENVVYSDARKKAEQELADNTPGFAAGVGTITTSDEQDAGKLAGSVADLKKSVGTIDSQISQYTKALTSSTLSPADRTQLQAQLKAAEASKAGVLGQVERAEGIANYSKMKTAQKLGYATYTDFLNAESNKILPEIKKLYPNGIKTRSGKTLTQAQIAEAVLEGRVTNKWSTSTSSGGGMTMGTSSSQQLLGTTLIDKDGKSIFIKAEHGASKLSALASQATNSGRTRMEEFKALNTQMHKENVKDYSTQDVIMTLNDKQKKEVSDLIQGGSAAVKMKKPGGIEDLPEDERPTNFRTAVAGTPAPNGDTRIIVTELDENDKPTGKTFEAHINNTNVGEKFSRILGRQPTPEGQMASAVYRTGAASTMLKGQPVGFKLDLGQIEHNGQKFNAAISINKDDNGITYNLVAPDGSIISQSSDLGTTNYWVSKKVKK